MKKIKKVVAAVKKVGTLNLVLILVGAFFVWFNWQMILVFREYGSMPETYACAVVAATIGECGILSLIHIFPNDAGKNHSWSRSKVHDLFHHISWGYKNPQGTGNKGNIMVWNLSGKSKKKSFFCVSVG